MQCAILKTPLYFSENFKDITANPHIFKVKMCVLHFIKLEERLQEN